MSDWLDVLEAKVHEAAERLREQRDRNRELEIRLQELQERLDAAESAGARAWAAERDEIRTRVERLTAGLEELVAEG
jgi:chromosome segregation ATPase